MAGLKLGPMISIDLPLLPLLGLAILFQHFLPIFLPSRIEIVVSVDEVPELSLQGGNHIPEWNIGRAFEDGGPMGMSHQHEMRPFGRSLAKEWVLVRTAIFIFVGLAANGV